VIPPTSGDSKERYDEIWRRIQLALDPGDLENPTGDGIIDTVDTRWIMDGVSRSSTITFAIFEPNARRIHVSFQAQQGQAAVGVTPAVLEWSDLFP
jgi:hypothetical protein